MSTNSNCVFLEYRPGQWYYLLEHANAPKNAWSWRDYADAYGPFGSEEAAKESLSRNHANPGGWWIRPYDPAHLPDAKDDELVAKAFRPRKDGGVERNGVIKSGPFTFIF